MKKLLLIPLLLLLLGCTKEDINEEIIKYRLSDGTKIVVELKENSDLHYEIEDNFYIKFNNELIGSVKFINKEQCTSILETKELEIIKEDEHGISYKEENYHYLNKDNQICVLLNAKELDNLNKILDNVDIRLEGDIE